MKEYNDEKLPTKTQIEIMNLEYEKFLEQNILKNTPLQNFCENNNLNQENHTSKSTTNLTNLSKF